MHLDWIWMSGLRSTGSQVLPLDFSDHHAVWTRLAFD
jgi:endonuclease/exonuclease/phosphatase (EEP) superfamily protein YafD